MITLLHQKKQHVSYEKIGDIRLHPYMVHMTARVMEAFPNDKGVAERMLKWANDCSSCFYCGKWRECSPIFRSGPMTPFGTVVSLCNACGMKYSRTACIYCGLGHVGTGLDDASCKKCAKFAHRQCLKVFGAGNKCKECDEKQETKRLLRNSRKSYQGDSRMLDLRTEIGELRAKEIPLGKRFRDIERDIAERSREHEKSEKNLQYLINAHKYMDAAFSELSKITD